GGGSLPIVSVDTHGICGRDPRTEQTGVPIILIDPGHFGKGTRFPILGSILVPKGVGIKAFPKGISGIVSVDSHSVGSHFLGQIPKGKGLIAHVGSTTVLRLKIRKISSFFKAYRGIDRYSQAPAPFS